jgi:hypothetical protein
MKPCLTRTCCRWRTALTTLSLVVSRWRQPIQCRAQNLSLHRLQAVIRDLQLDLVRFFFRKSVPRPMR